MKTPWPIRWTMVVDHVYDGDTIIGDVQIDMGLGMRHVLTDWRLRLYGIDAPEMTAPNTDIREQAYAARDYLRSLTPAGLALPFDSYGFDNYGKRIDGVPYIGESSVCEMMLTQPGVVVVAL